MLSLDELSNQINDVRERRLALDDFEDWFRDNSIGAYASDDPRIVELHGSIESLFSEYHFRNASAAAISEQLEMVIFPFVQPIDDTIAYTIDLRGSANLPMFVLGSASDQADQPIAVHA